MRSAASEHLSVVPPEDWRANGLCRTEQYDPEWWYPPSKSGEESLDHPDAAEAAAVCRRCPVLPECLEWALEHELKHGIWAGTTPRQRQRMVERKRRARRKAMQV